MRTPWKQMAVTATVGCLAALVVAGCGSGTDDEATADTLAVAGGQGGAQAFQECMQEQGVELPQGGPGGGGPGGPPPGDGDQTRPAPGAGGNAQDGPPPGGPERGNLSEEQRAAFEVCRDKAPNGGQPPQLTEEQRKELQQQRTKMEACLKKRGVTTPDRPQRGDQRNGGERPQMDTKTRKAMEACGFRGGPGGGPGGPGGPGGQGGSPA